MHHQTGSADGVSARPGQGAEGGLRAGISSRDRKPGKIPADAVPVWKPGMINQFRQDDIYVEMTFIRTLEVHGWDVSLERAGIDFANSGYPLWHANRAGRDNLRRGIAPPDSGHPEFNIDAKINGAYIVIGLLAQRHGHLDQRRQTCARRGTFTHPWDLHRASVSTSQQKHNP